MRLDRIPRKNLSPIALWLMDYVKKQDTSLSVLSRQSGLSNSALRYLIIDPKRTPTVETCMKLSHATNTPLDDILTLANVPGALPGQDKLQPGRLELMRIFNSLPHKYQQTLVSIARVFLQTNPPSDETGSI